MPDSIDITVITVIIIIQFYDIYIFSVAVPPVTTRLSTDKAADWTTATAYHKEFVPYLRPLPQRGAELLDQRQVGRDDDLLLSGGRRGEKIIFIIIMLIFVVITTTIIIIFITTVIVLSFIIIIIRC